MALYMDSNISAARVRSSSSNSVTFSVGRCKIGSGYLTISLIMFPVECLLPIPDAIRYPLVLSHLLHVTVIVTFQLPERIPAKLLERQLRHGQRHHGLGRHTRRRNYADVAAFVGRPGLFTSVEPDRLERPPQRGNRLEIAPDNYV